MTFSIPPGMPVPPRLPEPPVREMSNAELAELVRAGSPFRGKAVYALGDRAVSDDDAATVLGELTYLPVLREDRFHLVSMAGAAIVALLAAATPHARQVAYRAFAALPESEQRDLLLHLRSDRIENAHPTTP
ncbi:hypothetical protein FB565_001614 [Actinoplanes lutulentus]|uniref:HEAT repeat protein n=1 Tax=Actinoplanes lutulentus TaxID=1287878 RepID=A0A327ZKZ0_9ACTN|nr:hypothetical protein [Actinoplanes lutulentus]MBB2941910.1 hypothetical protein [Actinoplanes lutulentus]RAK39827.1 hypothetical protein B0I29_104366 [Actinoplanes lutulentus]